MSNLIGTIGLLILMPIFIIANVIHTQRQIREERKLAEKENIPSAEKHW